MINLSYYLDVRYVQKKTGLCALKLRITSGGTKSYLPLGCNFCFDPIEWDQKLQVLTKKCKSARLLNSQLGMMMVDWQTKVDMHFKSYENPKSDEVLYVLLNGEKRSEKKSNDSNSVLALFERYSKLKEDRPKSAESFRYTATRIERYLSNACSLTWDDIDYTWLKTFENWLLRGDKDNKALSVNSTAIHLENLRAVMNYAIEEGFSDKYPFKRFEIKRQRVVKQIMSLPDLIRLFSMVGSNEQEDYYLDIYRLIFCLCGINISDLFEARDSDVVDGRLEFDRNKTGVHVSIKIEPEAWNYINKHKGKNGYLVDLANKYVSSQNFGSQINKNLKKIGDYHWEGHFKVIDKAYWPYASTYTARRNWATLAGMEDFSVDTIGMGLGHKDSSVTAIYIRPYLKKLDKANRRLLDIVTGKEMPSDLEALED